MAQNLHLKWHLDAFTQYNYPAVTNASIMFWCLHWTLSTDIWNDSGTKKSKIYFNNKPKIASRFNQRLIDSVTNLACASQRHITVLLWLCLELFSVLKKIMKKQELLCLKFKSLNINFLFIELFIKSVSHLQLCWYLEKTSLFVWY